MRFHAFQHFASLTAYRPEESRLASHPRETGPQHARAHPSKGVFHLARTVLAPSREENPKRDDESAMHGDNAENEYS